MKRLLSVMLCIALIITVAPMTVATSDSAQYQLAQFPSVITEQQIETNGLKRRLSKYDSYTNAIGYENEDGSETVFIYTDDIKYKDENGKIRDKDINIASTNLLDKASGYSYKTKSNDIQVYFSDKMSNDKGIKIEYKDKEIKLAPKVNQQEKRISTKQSVKLLKDTGKYGSGLENIMQYDQAISESTHLRFETTYSGLKEDIILDEYTGTNRFTFIADFDDLTPVAYNRGVQIYDGDSVIMEIPPIYMEDSGGEFDAGSRFSLDNNIELSALPDGTYELTIVVDNDFLTSSDTVYPVIIDPSINISSTSHSDASVYSQWPDDNWAGQLRNNVGTDRVLGTGVFYTKFDISALSGIRYDNITSAFYRCYELTENTENSVIQAFLVREDWSESEVTWNNRPACNGEKLCAVNVNSVNKSSNENYWYDFYITSAVMAWLQGVPNYGIGLWERTHSGWKGFGSEENSSYMPYLMVSYVNEEEVSEGLGLTNWKSYYIKNKRSGLYLTTSGDYDEANIYQSNFTGSSNQKWTLKYQGDGYYKIHPENSDRLIDIYGGSEYPSGNMNDTNIQLYQNNGGYNQHWKIVRNWNGTYRFLSRLSGYSRAFVVQGASYSSGENVILYDYSSDYMFNDDWTLEPVELGDADFYSFTNSGEYNIDTTTNINLAVALAESIGFTGYDLQNRSAYDAYNFMMLDGLWYFTGHGNPSSVWFNSCDDGVWKSSYIKASGVYNTSYTYLIDLMPVNQLKELSLAVFSSCYTGENLGTSNMVGNVYKRGAHYVVAHVGITEVGCDHEWMIQFFTALNDGYCIYDAMELADEYLYSVHGSEVANLNQRHTLGDGSVVLKH